MPTNSKFNAKYPINATLAAIIGEGPHSRPEITSLLWKYIKANNLQDPAAKRIIVADAKLKVFLGGADRIDMMQLAKFVSLAIVK